ncbi:MAG: hypothetical protein FWE08_06065 [Oscillospiraceae bacterium]|nr:hypothetical protein [Oscillospiraceae bacterium]
MTPWKLNEIRERCEAATPGPWMGDDNGCYVFGPEQMMICQIRGWGHLTGGRQRLSDDEAIAIQEANEKFIAHARQDIPALVGVVEELLEALKDAQTKSEALERAMRGYCICCANIRPPEKGAAAERFPLMGICEHYPRLVTAFSAKQKLDCKYWKFDEAQFAGEA